MDLSSLPAILNHQPVYRLKQVKQAVLADLIDDWRQATALPQQLRSELQLKCSLAIKAKILTSTKPETVKALITLDDSLQIESVLLRHKDGRNTVCVSSQVGCPLACVFCATGQLGFKRNLTVWEIVEQVVFWARYLQSQKAKVTNVVFMGMGEPLLNYDQVLGAIRTLNDHDGFNLGARNFSLSTAGIIPGIKKLAQEKLQLNLALSLHAADEILRSRLMPVNKQYPLAKVMSAIADYVKRTNRRVMFEYLLLRDVNDSEEQARQLAALVKQPLYFVNLILYNPTGQWQPSTTERVKAFKNILLRQGVKVTERYRFGQEIKAACGQLAGKRL